VVQAIASVAKRLGNTKSVCRKCYIHPAILAAYMDGKPMASDEAGVATMLGRKRGRESPAA
jgi:DNA topoisomerase IB